MVNKRSKSSRKWLQRQNNDEFVQKAKDSGYRSRAAFKLIEIAKKYHIFKKVSCIVDLGAAPGGWLQVIKNQTSRQTKIYGLDLLPIEPIKYIDVLQGDFTDESVIENLLTKIADNRVDLVLSDMAPNMTGIKDVDIASSFDLAEKALDFCKKVLAPGGNFLVKLFQGHGFEEYVTHLRKEFAKVTLVKPNSSRKESREIYALAINKIS